MPVLRSIRERLAVERPLDGLRVGACLHVTAETACLVRALAAGGAEVALARGEPADHAGRRRRRAASPTAAPRTAAAARTPTPTPPASSRSWTARRTSRSTTAPTSSRVLHAARPQLLDGLSGGTEETTTGLVRLRALARRGPARLPGHRGQRGAHRAAVQRPLRHGPVDARRHPARDQPAARRQDARRARLRLDRQGRRAARPRRRRPGDRLRGRPDARARGAHGGLRGHAGARRGRARRRVRDRDRQPRRALAPSTSRA